MSTSVETFANQHEAVWLTPVRCGWRDRRDIDGGSLMQTLRFEDRDWLERNFVRDHNGRIVSRDEYEVREDFREALRSHNSQERPTPLVAIVQSLLLGGVIWSAAMLLA